MYYAPQRWRHRKGQEVSGFTNITPHRWRSDLSLFVYVKPIVKYIVLLCVHSVLNSQTGTVKLIFIQLKKELVTSLVIQGTV